MNEKVMHEFIVIVELINGYSINVSIFATKKEAANEIVQKQIGDLGKVIYIYQI